MKKERDEKPYLWLFVPFFITFRKLFRQVFPLLIEICQFCFDLSFFPGQLLAFDRVGIDFFLRHKLVDGGASFFQFLDPCFCTF